ncbi:phage major capsid protein, P2 family [Sphingomonas sp. Leaf4]|uniref:phage major capsid protein, P2 family n=1 Tax=Sphingomonas sp. Leaf4 TaxID=2876553 RepID=UPI001E2F802E|nr:phage major capsid protein, P2 family [Sphingomonas sp. Leaf4]
MSSCPPPPVAGVREKVSGAGVASSFASIAENRASVAAQEGEKVGVGVTRPIASRTRTDPKTGKRRIATDPTETGDRGRYRCEITHSDVGIRYSKLDQWRHRPEFQQLISEVIVKQHGRDRIMIGWNGVACAENTDIEAFPLLQDVNYGWLYKIRTHADERVLADGDLTTGATKAIYVASGEGIELVNADASNTATANADFANLDAVVYAATELLDEWNRDDTDLVVIVGRDLVHSHFANFINTAGNTPTEVEARNRILTLPKQVGGKQAIMVPFFPADALLITRLDNLSIYSQEGTRRRQLRDEPDYEQIADYQSVNESYVVEDYGICALVENIRLRKKPAA